MNRWKGSALAAALLSAAVAVLLVPSPAAAADTKGPESGAWTGRAYDLRSTIPTLQTFAANPARDAAIASWRTALPDLAVTRDERTGAVRSLMNRGGYLTGQRYGSAEAIAVDFVRGEVGLFGLSVEDLDDYEVAKLVPSKAAGLTHVVLRQRHNGYPLYNAPLQVSVKDDGRILSVHNQFLPRLAEAANLVAPAVSRKQAEASVAELLGERAAGMTSRAAEARLMYLPIRGGEARLVWTFEVETADRKSWYFATVDAADGRVWTLHDWVAEDSYKVYEIPVESPNHTSPLPPGDGRTTQVNPATGGSPFNWHDTNGAAGAEFTTTQGNNVHAYTDVDANNTPDAASSPDGTASLVFNFPLDLTLAPSGYRPAAVTNLFYWNNVQHDVLYNYGFDEASGNFQENNYGNGGPGSDYVNAEAQDGAGTNNANFATPADGQNPRMQMFIWTAPTPDRDGDVDNGIILHEYGHGVSNRLTGDNVGCLGNAEQMGEGWSDWMTVTFTAIASHTSTTNRGVGTYALNQATNGPGIRPAPYTTDMTVNNFTYSNLGAAAVPHGVGFIWNTMLWEMYWGLVAEHGFNPDLYDDWESGGNNLAMQLVIDGMKGQPCSPGFVDGRDAILAADLALTGGENSCIIWAAFAKRGLGFGASQGSNNNTSDGTASFVIPSGCSLIGAGADARVCAGTPHVQNIQVGTAFEPPVDMSATGNPAGTTAVFSQDPVAAVPAAITLTIGNTGVAAAGIYPITVTGTDADESGNEVFNLTVDVGVATAPALTAPANGATGVSTAATLDWADVAAAGEYDVQVDNNADFSSPVFTATVTSSQATATGLLGNTQYFWRVRSSNACGDGAFSGVFSFTTAMEFCNTTPLPIPDSPTPPVSSTIVIPAGGGTVNDVDVKIVATHTWVGDLRFTLANAETAAFFIIDRPGVPTSTNGCSSNDINVTVNDEGSSSPTIEAQCDATPPAINGNRVGSNPLSAFDGDAISGTWTLTVEDEAGADVGTLTQWCLVIGETLPSLIFADGFASGNTSAWDAVSP